MLRGVVAFVVLGGCDLLFQLDRIGNAPGDGAIDGDGGDNPLDAGIDALRLCGNPVIDDQFANGMPCDGWAQSFEQMGGCTITENANGLVMQPAAQTGSNCRCSTGASRPFSADGVIVEVDMVLGGNDDDFTLLSLGAPLDVSIGVTNGMLLFENNVGSMVYASLAYDPVRMRWWRLRQSASNVVAQYSSNGTSWVMLGLPQFKPATAAPVYLYAGLNPGNATVQGGAIYKRLVVCP
jgi:hypothetical protein